MVTKAKVLNKLKKVIDPEIGLNIVDLGFIYGIKIEKDKVRIVMTLTIPICPLADQITNEAKQKTEELEEVKKVEVELTFDPPWNPKMIKTEKIKEKFS